eukprot:scaffold2028_cov191-Amphora_coffeaeformis.AAC.12
MDGSIVCMERRFPRSRTCARSDFFGRIKTGSEGIKRDVALRWVIVSVTQEQFSDVSSADQPVRDELCSLDRLWYYYNSTKIDQYPTVCDPS